MICIIYSASERGSENMLWRPLGSCSFFRDIMLNILVSEIFPVQVVIGAVALCAECPRFNLHVSESQEAGLGKGVPALNFKYPFPTRVDYTRLVKRQIVWYSIRQFHVFNPASKKRKRERTLLWMLLLHFHKVYSQSPMNQFCSSPNSMISP